MTRKNTLQKNNRHAIVIGASIAGLVTARVLSDHFEKVTIIERDQLSEAVEARKGVPQGHHLHFLLTQGQNLLREFFPLLFDDLTDDGAIPISPTDIQWYQFDSWRLRIPTGTQIYSQSRPLLEHHIRNHLKHHHNVSCLDTCNVTRLMTNTNHSRITGVVLQSQKVSCEEELSADLVIDASGRGSRSPQWLQSLGYNRVQETSIPAQIGYASRIFRYPNRGMPNWKALVIPAIPPDEKREGLLFPLEMDRWIVTLCGRYPDYPPDDDDGFLEHARSLPKPDLYETIKNADALTPIVSYRYSANCWRHYERLSPFPEGLIVLGDALCSFNPIYAQGMTVAALEAKILDHCFKQVQSSSEHISVFTQPFQKALAQAIKAPWLISISEDFRYQSTQKKFPLFIRFLNWYTLRIGQLTASSPFVTARLDQVIHLLKKPIVLLHPRITGLILLKELCHFFQRALTFFGL